MTRSLAAQRLGALKIASSRSALARVLATDSQEQVRQAAAFSLRQIEDPGATDALGKALKDSSPNVRILALTGWVITRMPAKADWWRRCARISRLRCGERRCLFLAVWKIALQSRPLSSF